MKYELFSRLYHEALEYSNLDHYVTERGWQDWMDDFENVGAVLTLIYNLATNDFATNRKRITNNRTEFSKIYNIPLRSLENWESGSRQAPDYVKELIDYTIFGEIYDKA